MTMTIELDIMRSEGHNDYEPTRLSTNSASLITKLLQSTIYNLAFGVSWQNSSPFHSTPMKVVI